MTKQEIQKELQDIKECLDNPSPAFPKADRSNCKKAFKRIVAFLKADTNNFQKGWATCYFSDDAKTNRAVYTNFVYLYYMLN